VLDEGFDNCINVFEILLGVPPPPPPPPLLPFIVPVTTKLPAIYTLPETSKAGTEPVFGTGYPAGYPYVPLRIPIYMGPLR